MNNLRISFLCIFAFTWTSFSAAQTNTFPLSGNVGIGTTSPGSNLQVRGTGSPGTPTAVVEYTWANYSNEAEDNRPFVIRRSASSFEQLDTYVQDTALFFNYRNDETYSSILFRLRNTDSETGDGSNASDRNVLKLASSQYGGTAVFDANVGVGTLSPQAKLEVNGQFRVTGLGPVPASGRGLEMYWADSGSLADIFAYDRDANAMQRLRLRGSDVVIGADSVGIGTETPSHKLDVNGTIRAKEIIVETGWADHVFAPDYELAPLSEVEAHIKANQRLPGIPSAAEIGETGVSLGQSQTMLLEKIEELTLHAIEQQKRIEQKDDRIDSLESRLAAIERSLSNQGK